MAERARGRPAFNAARGKNWGDAAEILNGFNKEDIERLLNGLSKEQLRQLDAGAMRQIGSFAGRVHGPIMARLGKQPGHVFGRLNFLPGSPENGGGPLTAYAFPVAFSFAPDADIVRATEIAYVQTVPGVIPRPAHRGKRVGPATAETGLVRPVRQSRQPRCHRSFMPQSESAWSGG